MNTKVKIILKRILLIIVVALSAGLQYSAARYITIAGVVPNLMFVTAVIAGFTLGSEAGGLSGLALGLYQDAQSGKILGMHALLFLYAGAMAGIFPKKLKAGALPSALIAVYAMTVVYEGALFLTAYTIPILRSGYVPGVDALSALGGIIVPAAFLNTFCSIPYYLVLKRRGVPNV